MLMLWLLCASLSLSLFIIIIITGHWRWLFQLEPAAEKQSTANLNLVRIEGKTHDSVGNEKVNIYQLADKTNTVEIVFVSSITEPRIVADVDMAWGSYASPNHKLWHR